MNYPPRSPLNRGVKTKVKVPLTRGIEGVVRKDELTPHSPLIRGAKKVNAPY